MKSVMQVQIFTSSVGFTFTKVIWVGILFQAMLMGSLHGGWVFAWLITGWANLSTSRASEKTFYSRRKKSVLRMTSSVAFHYLQDQLRFCRLNSVRADTSTTSPVTSCYFFHFPREYTQDGLSLVLVSFLLINDTPFVWSQFTEESLLRVSVIRRADNVATLTLLSILMKAFDGCWLLMLLSFNVVLYPTNRLVNCITSKTKLLFCDSLR